MSEIKIQLSHAMMKGSVRDEKPRFTKREIFSPHCSAGDFFGVLQVQFRFRKSTRGSVLVNTAQIVPQQVHL